MSRTALCLLAAGVACARHSISAAYDDSRTVTLNGVVTQDVHDSAAATGIIALQLHAGPEMRVEFRNLKLKRLP